MNTQQVPTKKFKEQEIIPEILIDDSEIEEGTSQEDFLELNEDGYHRKASNYIDTLTAKFSLEDLDRMDERISQLDECLFAGAMENDLSISMKNRALGSIIEEYSAMVGDDKEGFIIISYLEVLFVMYGRVYNKASTNEFFQEILSQASLVMKDPKLLKRLYNFSRKRLNP